MKKEKSQNANYKVVIIFLSLAVVTLFIFAFSLYKQKTELNKEKVSVITELETLKLDYESFLEENEELAMEVETAQKNIEKYIDSLKRHKVNANKLYWYKSQVKKLKKEQLDILHLNDSLAQYIELVSEDRDKLSTQLQMQVGVNDSLTGANNKLNEFINLRGDLNIIRSSVDGVRQRSNGKISITDKTNKISKVRVCYTIEKNSFAETEEKEFYISLTNSKGKVYGLNETISDDDKEIPYSLISGFYYDNKSNIDVCDYIAIPKKSKLSKGKYVVKIYDESLNELKTQNISFK